VAAYAVAGSSTADSAEVSRTMAARELITGGHGNSQESAIKKIYFILMD
jgi:hypothetical protein